MTETLAKPVWRSTGRSRGCGSSAPWSADHAIRGDHTLCGIMVDHHEWSDPTGHRCLECSNVPAGHAVYLDLIGPQLSYRKLDYWTRQGYLKALNPGHGSGFRRYWPAEEARVALMMARFVAVGLTLPAAHRAARNDGRLAEGVRVVISSEQDDHSGDDSAGVVRY